MSDSGDTVPPSELIEHLDVVRLLHKSYSDAFPASPLHNKDGTEFTPDLLDTLEKDVKGMIAEGDDGSLGEFERKFGAIEELILQQIGPDGSVRLSQLQKHLWHALSDALKLAQRTKHKLDTSNEQQNALIPEYEQFSIVWHNNFSHKEGGHGAKPYTQLRLVQVALMSVKLTDWQKRATDALKGNGSETGSEHPEEDEEKEGEGKDDEKKESELRRGARRIGMVTPRRARMYGL